MDTSALIWQDLTHINKAPIATQLWLNDEKSLTTKLKAKFENFSVQVLLQQKQIPHLHESATINNNDECIVREVELSGNGKVVVFARSIIPITKDTQEILSIGSKPLGEVLFNDPSVKRGNIQFTQTDNIWGRRSVFTIGNTKLLVSEFFMEELYA